MNSCCRLRVVGGDGEAIREALRIVASHYAEGGILVANAGAGGRFAELDVAFARQ